VVDPGQVGKRLMEGFTQRQLSDAAAWPVRTFMHWSYPGLVRTGEGGWCAAVSASAVSFIAVQSATGTLAAVHVQDLAG